MTLSDLVPPLKTLHGVIIGILAVSLAATAFHLGGLEGHDQADRCELEHAKADGQAQRTNALILAQRQALADQRIREVSADVARTEAARQALATQQATLASRNTSLAQDLATTRHALLELRNQPAAGFARAAPGADSASCAAVALRAASLGNLLDGCRSLVTDGLDLVGQGLAVVTRCSNLAQATASDAERYADTLRQWQRFDATVIHPPDVGPPER